MRTMLRRLSGADLRMALTSGAGALGIAEWFYHFHSFTLECAAFLATWYLLDGAFDFLRQLARRSAPPVREA
jgi:hypothetical protein